jgi:hypothetical protein
VEHGISAQKRVLFQQMRPSCLQGFKHDWDRRLDRNRLGEPPS